MPKDSRAAASRTYGWRWRSLQLAVRLRGAQPMTAMLPITYTWPRGVAGAGYMFAAAAYRVQATLPVTFTWQASGQAPVVRVLDGLDDTLVVTWEVAEPQTVMVHAVNAGAAVSATVAIQVAGRLYLPSVRR